MSEPKLLPCPFCGCKTPHIAEDMDDHVFFVICQSVEHCCLAEGVWGETREDAAELWNRRVPTIKESLTVPTPAISGETAEGLELSASLLGNESESDRCRESICTILREVAALKRAGVLK
jgi:Lar family restriction alleviation protein